MNILLLGDVHGKFAWAHREYQTVLQVHKRVDLLIQVGDFGFFPRLDPRNRWEHDFGHPCWFIDGNHDDHESLRELDPDDLVYGSWTYMPRGSIWKGFLFIGGARSIDAGLRKRGYDWWPEENISVEEQKDILLRIIQYQSDPRTPPIHTVITHDAPGGFDVSEGCLYTETEIIDGNRKFLQSVFDLVKPDRWYFGHYHHAMSGTYKGCRWRCLDMVRRENSDCLELLTYAD